MNRFAKTRLAPTPSGYLHAGNALNFLLTAALAKQSGAALFLRIDDGDRDRYRPQFVTDIFETLHFLQLDWQEGPRHLKDVEQEWSQRYRMHLYDGVLKKLRDENAVFACTCSRTQMHTCSCIEKKLPLDWPNASWRLLTDDATITVKTLDGKTLNAPLPNEMKNFVVRRKDGVPAYQLASVVDDLHFGIDVIVRGDDLWPSTLAQLYLAKKLNESRFAEISFYHHPLLTNEQGEKLSKSAGATSVKFFREQGKSAHDFLAYLGTRLQASAHTAGLYVQLHTYMGF